MEVQPCDQSVQYHCSEKPLNQRIHIISLPRKNKHMTRPLNNFQLSIRQRIPRNLRLFNCLSPVIFPRINTKAPQHPSTFQQYHLSYLNMP